MSGEEMLSHAEEVGKTLRGGELQYLISTYVNNVWFEEDPPGVFNVGFAEPRRDGGRDNFVIFVQLHVAQRDLTISNVEKFKFNVWRAWKRRAGNLVCA